MEPRTLYRPHAAWVGDVIPFYHDGWYWLYYLHDWRGIDDRPAATSWHLVRTRDLVAYEDLGEVPSPTVGRMTRTATATPAA